MSILESYPKTAADVNCLFIKHAAPLGANSLEDATKDSVLRGLTDALIVSGTATGNATDLEDVRPVKQTVKPRGTRRARKTRRREETGPDENTRV